jgi:F-type H+-transporting ATPase subunit a
VPKMGTGGCLVVILIVVGLLVGGFYLPAHWRFMPEISLAAEQVHLFGLSISNSLIATFLTDIVLIVVALLAFRRPKLIPGGLQNGVEAVIEIFYKMVEGAAGEQACKFFPLVASFFFFIMVSNWLGILPGFGSLGIWQEHHVEAALVSEPVAAEESHEATAQAAESHEGEVVLVPLFRSANADLNTTVGLALISVAVTQYFGFQALGLSYLKKFFNFSGPNILFKLISAFVGILELLSEFIKILSFSFRLFGNIFAGEVLLIVVGFLVAFLASLPFMFLELFVGVVQALIFSMLSLVFFMMATRQHGEESH